LINENILNQNDSTTVATTSARIEKGPSHSTLPVIQNADIEVIFNKLIFRIHPSSIL